MHQLLRRFYMYTSHLSMHLNLSFAHNQITEERQSNLYLKCYIFLIYISLLGFFFTTISRPHVQFAHSLWHSALTMFIPKMVIQKMLHQSPLHTGLLYWAPLLVLHHFSLFWSVHQSLLDTSTHVITYA